MKTFKTILQCYLIQINIFGQFITIIGVTNTISRDIDKPEAKAQSKAQSPKKPQKGKRGIWPLG